MKIHSIHQKGTLNSLEFPEVWTEISGYLKDIPMLVSHNAAFDIDCIHHLQELYDMEKPDIN